MQPKEVKAEVVNYFTVDTSTNGGESFYIVTVKHTDGDTIYYTQEIILQSYRNSASFNLASAVLTPAKLRQLADRLEKAGM